MTKQAPTLADLRDYALGRGSQSAADRVRRYLISSGDEKALAYVEAVTVAQRRVEAYCARAASGWRARIAAMVGGVGRAVTELHAPDLVVSGGLPATLSTARRHKTAHLESEAPRFLYLVAAQPTGVLTLIDPAAGAVDVRRAETDRASVPENTSAVIGMSASESLLVEGSARMSADLTALLPGLRVVGAEVGLTVREVEEDDDE